MNNSYPHMCRDGHQQIGFSGDGERCPVCVAIDQRDEAQAEVARCVAVMMDVSASMERKMAALKVTA